MTKIIFLDRDGVINDNANFLNSDVDIPYLSGLFDFCRAAVAKGYKLAVVTNQGGIAAGFTTFRVQMAIEKAMRARFFEEKCPLSAWRLCPHLPPDNKALVDNHTQDKAFVKDCDCRKPKPGMLKHIAALFDADMTQSWMIGDMQTDIDAGTAAGIPTDHCFLFTNNGYIPIDNL